MLMQIVIDKQLINPKFWNVEKLHIYALAYACVGISPKELPEWNDHALWHTEVECRVSSNSIRFKFPDLLYEFYYLMQPEMTYSLCGNADVVLMVIERKK